MSPGKDETRVCGYIRSEFIHWALWRTLIRTEYFLFVHHSTSILGKLTIWCFEHSGDISCFLLVNLSHTDHSWEGRNTCLWKNALNKFMEHFGEECWEENNFWSFAIPQSFWKRWAPGVFSTILISVVLNSLTWATRMSPGKDEIRVCGYALWIYSLSTLENTYENIIFFVRSPHYKHFGKDEHLVLWAVWWSQLFSTR